MKRSGKTNWLACLGIGCLVVIVGGGIGGWLVYRWLTAAARDLAASGIETVATEMAREFKLSPADEADLMQPIREFSGKIRSGDVGVQRALVVGQAIMESPLVNIFLIKTFETKYLDKFNLNQETRQQSHVILTRYVKGMVDKKIASDDRNKVDAIIYETATDAKGRTRRKLRETLSKEEMQKCLVLMRTAANNAQIPNQAFDYKLSDEVKKAIDKGMAQQL